ncbi:MAG: bifunctional 4-hydroxy-2-oxoglutarate aldolase/2-dehydro-3-deoxy-phosphogluconate aldolase [Bacilli bacterium]|nr:bifunctional 4-hydroxy-2-oxoglutarate aldolase/2-dehydro-3-deoxy-phosphogluconate aldolase [Bacilli bacterium]
MEIVERLSKFGIVPVIVINDTKDALPLAKALIDGDLPCAEITFRTAAAEESIRIISKAYPEILVGAGTVLSIEQVKKAVNAGAKFIVAPGFDPELVDYCIKENIPVFPGCLTPSELTQAVKRNLEVVKFFPAETFGGLKAIKAVSAPFGSLKFMPTGGLNATNVVDYLLEKKIFACGGTWIAKKELIEAGEFDTIAKLAKEASDIVKKIRG